MTEPPSSGDGARPTGPPALAGPDRAERVPHRAAFVREHTVLEKVPYVPSIVLHTATELVPIWRATEDWLATRGLQVPFWCVPWVGGQALARWVLDHPEVVRGRSVLDFGCGSGLLAIAAAQAGAASVRAVDVDPVAVEACFLNAEANGVGATVEPICVDLVGETVPESIVVAGDVWYEREPSARFTAWFRTLAGQGTRILTGDPDRVYVPSETRELAVYEDIPTTAELESATRRRARVLEILPLRVV